MSSHFDKDCPVSHTLCCYTTIIVTIIEAVLCPPSEAYTQNTTMHSNAAVTADTGTALVSQFAG